MPRMRQASATALRTVTYENLWQEGRWLRNATVAIDAGGRVAEVTTAARADAATVPGFTLPGLVDAHCHAFQRPLGAWTQRSAGQRDDFWGWREAMYALARLLDRDGLEAISARCYLELLRGGYTEVAEFLYLHRCAGGEGLDADQAVAAAARRTGIALTLLPTLYQHSGFGGAAPTPGQQPFVRSSAQFLEDWQELRRRHGSGAAVALGVAFHSLRAVDIEEIGRVHAALEHDPLCRCVHIHVAEQPAEVAACVRQHGLPPVALLADRGLLSRRWALVHGTHASAAELLQLRDAGATLVMCPTTEADLGDGCPVLAPFLDAGGQMAIGSDSNIGRNALVELRLLEWSQRLARGGRNLLSSAAAPATADRLYRLALHGGRCAVGGSARADYVTYDARTGDGGMQEGEDVLSALVFDSEAPRAQQVMVAGSWVIRDGRHADEARIETQYRDTVRRLRAAMTDRKHT
jgi:formimidoylglutamate deiminase